MKKTDSSKISSIREAAEASLNRFIKLIAPHRVLGSVHEEMVEWWTREEAKTHQLTLLPRDHQKSAMIAYRVAWEITKDPTLTVLYISSTANLAEKQLYFIKSILSSKIYRKYWPEMVHEEEGKRDKWTQSEIAVDHPLRKIEGIREPTVFTAGLTSSITGLHATLAVLDDVVVYENAYTDEGRSKVESQYSLLSSVESADCREWVVGTRYHPQDLYGKLMEMETSIYDDNGEVIRTEHIYEVFQREVEDSGNGNGEFLWPRQQRPSDGKWFGFNADILSRKREKYLDKTQFYAQYYNNPNDPSGDCISSDLFQYYDQAFVTKGVNGWSFRDRKLNIVASMDFAFSLKKKADYSAIVVIGMDYEHNVYVLDIDRFKTDKISEYFNHMMNLYKKWEFRKLRTEVSIAQQAIVSELKSMYIIPNGLILSVDEYRPNRHQGSKEERVNAILEPRYAEKKIWHYRGGNCQILEEELKLAHPPHDDVKDCLASAIDAVIAPSRKMGGNHQQNTNVFFHPRWGGVVA